MSEEQKTEQPVEWYRYAPANQALVDQLRQLTAAVERVSDAFVALAKAIDRQEKKEEP